LKHSNFRTNGGVDCLALEIVGIGGITVESGKLAVFDPIAMFEEGVLARAVPCGNFRVEMLVAVVGDGVRAVAAVRVLFTDSTPDHFEYAAMEPLSLDNVEPGEFFGFGVDAGAAAILDAAYVSALFREETETRFTSERCHSDAIRRV
jgi:hypothetical protein